MNRIMTLPICDKSKRVRRRTTEGARNCFAPRSVLREFFESAQAAERGPKPKEELPNLPPSRRVRCARVAQKKKAPTRVLSVTAPVHYKTTECLLLTKTEQLK